ncbi:MAG: Hsp20/alpha crystallin family protein [Myxococcales bacterium]|nr:Hsp20/alpha crystallin family protein [Myxococcales bacterium]
MAEQQTQLPARVDPFEELDLWSPFRLTRLLDPTWSRRLARSGAFVPAVDVAEDDKQYSVTVEVPGINKNDVTLEIQDNVLTIRGEKRSEREEKKEQMRYVERSYGSFSRSFTLPSNAKADQVRAAFKDGVLTIEIPKTEEPKARTISIR